MTCTMTMSQPALPLKPDTEEDLILTADIERKDEAVTHEKDGKANDLVQSNLTTVAAPKAICAEALPIQENVLIDESPILSKGKARRPSFTSKEAEDVAAAVRFRLELEKVNRSQAARVVLPSTSKHWKEASTRLWRAVSIEGRPGISKSRLTSARDSQRLMKNRKGASLADSTHSYEDTLSTQTDVKSKIPASEPNFQVISPADSLEDDEDTPLLGRKTVSELQHDAIKTRKIRRQFNVYQRGSGIPPLPPLWPFYSVNVVQDTTGISNSTTPTSTASDLSESEPQCTSQNQNEEADVSTTNRGTDNSSGDAMQNPAKTMEQVLEKVKPYIKPPLPSPDIEHKLDLKRKRSLFRWLHKRSELEDLIEMYMDDDQAERSSLKKKPGKPRSRTLWPTRSVTAPTAISDGSSLLQTGHREVQLR